MTGPLAISPDGVGFSTAGFGTKLAPPYLRLCNAGGRYIGIAWGGELFTSDTLFGPFKKGPPQLERPNGPDLVPRHPALVWKNSRLHCFYSLIGDCPERIWHICVEPGIASNDWQADTPKMILAPAAEWEGAALPQAPSRIGAASGMEHALRDPFVFEDHLFYVAGGESCIAVARVNWR